jgi:hypothetical protein
VPDHEWLIDQVLAARAAAGPAGLVPVPGVTFEQVFVSGIYDAIVDERRGYGSEKELERCIQRARSAKIPEDEIEAAIAAARRTARGE